MEKQNLTIAGRGGTIPAVLWGAPQKRLLLLVHGLMSNKEDAAIVCAAEAAAGKGMAALSFDLPEHGARGEDHSYACTPENGRSDLLSVYARAREISDEIYVFACSLGAYVTLLSLPELATAGIYLLSPILRMDLLINSMMAAAGVTPERLEREKHIPVEGNQPLDWDYYTYVLAHPVPTMLPCPAAILRGEYDTLCTAELAAAAAKNWGAALDTVPRSEHWFHTDDQLAALADFLDATLPPIPERMWLARLQDKDAVRACSAADFLEAAGRDSDLLLRLRDGLTALLTHKNSLVRNRAIRLLAAGAAQGGDGAALTRALLPHIADEKPITARTCIAVLPRVAAAFPTEAARILAALRAADASHYADSMRPLVARDLTDAAEIIERGAAQ